MIQRCLLLSSFPTLTHRKGISGLSEKPREFLFSLPSIYGGSNLSDCVIRETLATSELISLNLGGYILFYVDTSKQKANLGCIQSRPGGLPISDLLDSLRKARCTSELGLDPDTGSPCHLDLTMTLPWKSHFKAQETLHISFN